MKHDRRSSWFRRWLLGGLLCFACVAVGRAQAVTYGTVMAAGSWIHPNGAPDFPPMSGSVSFQLATWPLGGTGFRIFLGGSGSGSVIGHLNVTQTSTVVCDAMGLNGTFDTFYGTYKTGPWQWYRDVTMPAKAVTVIVTAKVSIQHENGVYTPQSGFESNQVVASLYWDGSKFTDPPKNYPVPGAPNYRTAPVSLHNPYDFDLKMNFWDTGANKGCGSVLIGPGETWTGQIDSYSGQEIAVYCQTPTGYQMAGDGSIEAGGAGNVTWRSGTVLAGENVGRGVGNTPNSGAIQTGNLTTMPGTSVPSSGTSGSSSSGSQGMATTGGHIAWGSASSGRSLTDTQYRAGVEAVVDATQQAASKIANAVGSGSGSGSGSSGVDPRPNIDALGTKLDERWQAEDEESKKRRAFGDALADRYEQAKSFDSGAELSSVTGNNPGLSAPGSWSSKSVTVSDPGGVGNVTLPGPDGSISVSWGSGSLPGGLSGVASWGKALLLVAASVWLVRGCLADMRAYLVGLGAVAPAGSGVLVGVESVAPGVPQAKAVGLALAATAAMALAWAGLAAFLSTGTVGDAFGRLAGFSLDGGLGVLSDWVPFAGLVAIWVARATFDLVAAPVYLAAVAALKFMSV